MTAYFPNGNVLRRTVEKWAGRCRYDQNVVLNSILKTTRSNPYRPRNDQHEHIFVHVPRTGGTSIAEALFQEGARGHIPLYVFRTFDPARYDRYFKFAFVRNPYGRLVSAFHQVKNNAPNPRTQQWAETHLDGVDSFRSFLQRLAESATFRWTVTSMDHFRPQWEFLTVNGAIDVDYLGRFEQIESDFEKIAERLHLEEQLPHRNQSSHRSYHWYYQDKQTNVVERMYRRDFERLGYSPELESA